MGKQILCNGSWSNPAPGFRALHHSAWITMAIVSLCAKMCQADENHAPNLVPDGGFEDDVSHWSWEQWKGREEPGQRDTDNPFEGDACYRLSLPGYAGERFINTHTFPVKPDADYEFSVALTCRNMPAQAASVMILQWGTETTETPNPQGWITVPPGSGMSRLVTTGGTHPWKIFTVAIPGECLKPTTRRLSVYVRHAAAGIGVLRIDAVTMKATRQRPDLAEKPDGTMGAKRQAGDTHDPPPRTKPPKGNLYPGDTSFETGVAGWLNGLREPGPSPHGQHHLVAPAGLSSVRGPNVYQRIHEGLPYTLSFHASADEGPLDVLVDVWHLRYSIMKRTRIHLSPEWRRYTISIPPQKVDRSFYVVLTKEGQGTARIDALQFEQGEATPFEPSEAVSLTVGNTGQPGNILFAAAEAQQIPVRVFNAQHPGTRFHLSLTTTDHGNNIVATSEATLELIPGAGEERDVTILASREPGYYVTTVQLTDEKGTEILSKDVPCGVVMPPVVTGTDPESFFGLHPGVSREAMQRIGAKWLRNFRGWRWLERSEGSITLTVDDYAKARKDGFHLMETVRFSLQPDWARMDSPTDRDFTAFCRFLATIVQRAGDTVTYWEIENEPDLVMPSYTGLDTEGAAHFYADLVRESAAAINRANPDARIMACGVSGGDCRRHFPFSKATFGQVATLIDDYPIHPYANARHIGPDGTSIGPEANDMRDILLAAASLTETYGERRPIWIGELGWALDVRTAPLSRYARRHAEYVARALILAHSVPDVERVMWFKAAGCIERKHYEYGLWRSEYVPLPAAVAYAVTATMLHHAKHFETIFTSDLQAYAFIRGRRKQPVIALWRHRGEVSRMLADMAPEDVELTDMFGRNLDPGTHNGKLVVPVSESPIYMTTDTLDPVAFSKRVRDADVDLDPVTISVLFSDTQTLSGSVKNALPKPLAGQLTLTFEQNAAKNQPLGTAAVTLEPGGTQSFSFHIDAAEHDQEGRRTYLLTCITGEGTVTKTLSLSTQLCQKRTVAVEAALEEPTSENTDWIRLTERGDILPPDPGIGWEGPDDLSVKAAWSWDDNAFFFVAVVRDDLHHQTVTNSRAWKGDSIQLAFDAGNDAREQQLAFDSDDDWEYTIAKTPEGPGAFLTHGPEGTAIGAPAPHVTVAITREEDRTFYRVAIPWSGLAPLSPVAGRMFGFNFIVNDNDGTGRNYWMGMTPGIGEMKYPYCYRKVVLDGP